MRFFNTAGPVRCEDHYCLPPLTRLDLDKILELIGQQKYFVLHAPRQTGKTTCLLALMEHLNRGGQYRALYVNVEMAQAARENVYEGIRTILSQLASMAQIYLDDPFPEDTWADVLQKGGGYAALNQTLSLWAKHDPKPLVLLIDEIDALVGDTLISVLRQLRAGYTQRPTAFPQSVVLCGVRDVRDYRIHSSQEKAIITGGSAFNIKAESLRLGNFVQSEVGTVYAQHVEETGQRFEPETLELVWNLTRGQPWLTNALGYEVCFKMKQGRDRSRPITVDRLVEAQERIIQRRETHIDQLIDKLGEARVQRVIAPILQGENLARTVRQDDIQYVIDLGLVRRGEMGPQISNPIYREVIPRELGFITQLNLESMYRPSWYITPNARLDVDKMLTAFQQFFREHSEHWVERFDYKEAGPQLLIQAFLQRIINSGGRIEREYGLGRKRTDLLLLWRHPGGVQRAVIELEILYGSPEHVRAQGLEQTWEYMDRCGADEGHLIIFDREKDKSWQDKIFRQEEIYKEKTIKIWGM